MLLYKTDNLTSRQVLDLQCKILANLFRAAVKYAGENNLTITSTHLDDDNWHCSMTLNCFTNNDSDINDKPTFSVWFSYRENRYEDRESEYKIIKE